MGVDGVGGGRSPKDLLFRGVCRVVIAVAMEEMEVFRERDFESDFIVFGVQVRVVYVELAVRGLTG